MNIGCKLALVNAPIVSVAEGILKIRKQAVDFSRHPIKRSGEFFVQHTIRKFLRFLKILDIGEGVVIHGKGKPFLSEEPGEVFAPIEINLDIIGEPGLDFKEHPSEFRVVIVKIIVLAFGRP